MADVTKMTPLEKQFHQDCLDASETLRKKHQYNPTYFVNMVHQHGAVEAVRLLLKAQNYQAGLFTLWEKGLLHMSIEAAVVNPRWAALFTEEEKAVARKRLKDLNYVPKV